MGPSTARPRLARPCRSVGRLPHTGTECRLSSGATLRRAAGRHLPLTRWGRRSYLPVESCFAILCTVASSTPGSSSSPVQVLRGSWDAGDTEQNVRPWGASGTSAPAGPRSQAGGSGSFRSRRPVPPKARWSRERYMTGPMESVREAVRDGIGVAPSTDGAGEAGEFAPGSTGRDHQASLRGGPDLDSASGPRRRPRPGGPWARGCSSVPLRSLRPPRTCRRQPRRQRRRWRATSPRRLRRPSRPGSRWRTSSASWSTATRGGRRTNRLRSVPAAGADAPSRGSGSIGRKTNGYA